MTSQFSPKVSEILAYSREEALRLSSSSVKPEHLLLGMMRINNGAVYDVFNRMNIKKEDIKYSLEMQVQESDGIIHSLSTQDLQLNEQANNILNLNDVEMETAIEADDNCQVTDITEQAIRETGIDKAGYFDFRNQIAEEAQSMMLFTNQAMATRVLTNLLDNAMKFTTSGTVTLLTTTDGSNIQFSIEDTGTGIPAEEAEHIFERFVKLDPFQEGLGIGLASCRTMAQRIGGNVYLDQSYAGPGARFVLAIPI